MVYFIDNFSCRRRWRYEVADLCREDLRKQGLPIPDASFVVRVLHSDAKDPHSLWVDVCCKDDGVFKRAILVLTDLENGKKLRKWATNTLCSPQSCARTIMEISM